MELGRVDPAALDRRRESYAVVTPRHANLVRLPRATLRSDARSHVRLCQATLGQRRAHGPRYNRIVRVDEVEASARGDAVEEPEVPSVLPAVPSHVGNLRSGRQAAHGTGDDVEPSSVAELFTGGKQELIAEADPQERLAAVERPAEGGQQAQAVEVRYRVVKRAVPRQHHRFRVVDGARILGDHRRAADATKRLLDGPKISAPVVDNGDHRLASPSAAARTTTITGSPRLRLRLAPRRSQRTLRRGKHARDPWIDARRLRHRPSDGLEHGLGDG